MRRRLTAVGLAGLGLLAAAAGALAIRGALSAPVACGHREATASAVIAALAVGAFGLGHLAARYRSVPGDATTSRHPRATAIAVRGAFFAFLLLLVVVLAYETAALAGLDGWLPVTAYVRCARSAQPIPTALGTAVVAFLLGHWLWFPEQQRP